MPEELEFEPATQTPSEGDHPLSSDDFASGGVTDQTDTPPTTSEPPPAEVQTLTVRDIATQLGYAVPTNVSDDYSALAHLVSQAREAQQLRAAQQQQDVYRQLGQLVAPHADRLQGFLQPQTAPAGPKSWEPPPFDQRWIPLVDRDQATGMYVGKPGTPMEVVQAVNTWADWQDKFRMNPASMIQPMLLDMRTQIQEEYRRELQASQVQAQTRSAVQQIVANNSAWFYAQDSAGGYVRDPITGQPQSTPLGAQYIATLRQLEQRGVTDPVAKDEIARAILATQIAQATAATSQTQTTAARQQQASRGRMGNRNPLQALTADQGSQTPGYTPPDQGGLSLSDRLRLQFRQNGVTDDQILLPGN